MMFLTSYAFLIMLAKASSGLAGTITQPNMAGISSTIKDPSGTTVTATTTKAPEQISKKLYSSLTDN